jgi:hypothetical protein
VIGLSPGEADEAADLAARLSDPAQAAECYRDQMERYKNALAALTGEFVSV